MNFYDFLYALRRRWILVMLTTLLGAAANFGYAATRPPAYTASAQLFVMATGSQSPGDLAAGANYVKLQVLSYPQLVTSTDVLDKVRGDLGLTESTTALARKITVDIPPDTMWLNLSVKDGDAQRASDIARAVSTRFVQTAEALEARGGSGKPVRITVVDPSTKPLTADNRAGVMSVAVGALLGLCLGAVLAAWFALRSARRIHRISSGSDGIAEARD